jgi:hypothetical protein
MDTTFCHSAKCSLYRINQFINEVMETFANERPLLPAMYRSTKLADRSRDAISSYLLKRKLSNHSGKILIFTPQHLFKLD